MAANAGHLSFHYNQTHKLHIKERSGECASNEDTSGSFPRGTRRWNASFAGATPETSISSCAMRAHERRCRASPPNIGLEKAFASLCTAGCLLEPGGGACMGRERLIPRYLPKRR